MKNWLTVLTIVLSGWLGLSGPSRAEVHDHARLFSQEKIEQANSMIKDIEQKYHRDVTIETFEQPPSEKFAGLQKAGKNSTARARVFRDWMHERVKATGARGVYILISKNPGHVEVLSDDATSAKDFATAEELALAERFANDFREKRFDDGLIVGLEQVGTTMLAHQRIKPSRPVAVPSANPEFKPPQQHNKGSIMGWICVLIGIAVACWVVFGLIRAMTGANRQPMQNMGYQGGYQGGPPGYTPMYGGGGGGGFFSNFLGGMFGAVAGNWMYNNFFGGHHYGGSSWDAPAYGGDRIGGGGDFEGGSAGEGEFTRDPGAGADFGDDGGDVGGGGDFGGGDFGGDVGDGGGDFGGGDFGGDGGGGGDF
jgi:uncharacterized protein